MVSEPFPAMAPEPRSSDTRRHLDFRSAMDGYNLFCFLYSQLQPALWFLLAVMTMSRSHTHFERHAPVSYDPDLQELRSLRYFQQHLQDHTFVSQSAPPSYRSLVSNATSLPSADCSDYITVGGRTAGSPFAATLSPKYLVIVLEGLPNVNPNVMTPDGFLTTLNGDNGYNRPAQSLTFEDIGHNGRDRIRDQSNAIKTGFYNRADADFFASSGISWSLSRITKIGASTFDSSGSRHSSACSSIADLLSYGQAFNINVAMHTNVEKVLLASSSSSFAVTKQTAFGVIYRDQLGSYHQVINREKGEVILCAGALLVQCLLLFSHGIHPTVVSVSLHKASVKAVDVLTAMVVPVERSTGDSWVKASSTSLNSEVVRQYSTLLAPLVVNAVLSVVNLAKPDMVNLRDVKIVKQLSGTVVRYSKLITVTSMTIFAVDMSHQGGATDSSVASDDIRFDYLSGFSNHFSPEALTGALIPNQNSPLSCPCGLYGEQVAGASFTFPHNLNLRSWLYQVKPSVTHEPFKLRVPSNGGLLREFIQSSSAANPSQIRWEPMDLTDSPTEFVDGLFTICGAGSSFLRHGCVIRMYAADKSMDNCAFCNADGDFLMVPQRGFRFAVSLPVGPSRGYVAKILCSFFTFLRLVRENKDLLTQFMGAAEAIASDDEIAVRYASSSLCP